MINSFRIRNFRSFDEADVGELKLINVLVGDNGSGKTALLEAIWLALGSSPEVLLRTRTWRGFELKGFATTPDDLNEALWGDFFYRFEKSKPAVVRMSGDQYGENRSVTVKYNPPGSKRIVPPARNRPGAKPELMNIASPVEFVYRIGSDAPLTVTPELREDKLYFTPLLSTHLKCSFYAANQTAPSSEAARNFSKLSQSFKTDDFVTRFQNIFPEVRNIEIDISAGSPMLFATIKNLPRKIPLSLASGGTNKLAAILLSIVENEGGTVLVDEIENGFFHERLAEVWQAIYEFALHYRCQVFSSSHSLECLKAVANIAVKSPNDFSMLRTVRTEKGSRVRKFAGYNFVNAIQSNVEIR